MVQRTSHVTLRNHSANCKLQNQHHWFENVQDFSEVLEWSSLWPRFKAKAKTSEWCSRGSSRPRPGVKDNKTGHNVCRRVFQSATNLRWSSAKLRKLCRPNAKIAVSMWQVYCWLKFHLLYLHSVLHELVTQTISGILCFSQENVSLHLWCRLCFFFIEI